MAATATTLEPCVVTCAVSAAVPAHRWLGRPWQVSVSATEVGVVVVDVSEPPSAGDTETGALVVGTVVVSSWYVAIS